jgi:hypothetical protein
MSPRHRRHRTRTEIKHYSTKKQIATCHRCAVAKTEPYLDFAGF